MAITEVTIEFKRITKKLTCDYCKERKASYMVKNISKGEITYSCLTCKKLKKMYE